MLRDTLRARLFPEREARRPISKARLEPLPQIQDLGWQQEYE